MTKLWGGNYDAEPDRLFWEFNRSFPFDRRLIREEVAASRAYALALGRCRAISTKDASQLARGLARVLAKYAAAPAYAAIDGAAFKCDVGQEKDILHVIDETEQKFGPIALFCSNAGIGGGFDPMSVNAGGSSDEPWARSWAIPVSYTHLTVPASGLG